MVPSPIAGLRTRPPRPTLFLAGISGCGRVARQPRPVSRSAAQMRPAPPEVLSLAGERRSRHADAPDPGRQATVTCASEGGP